MRVNLPPYEEPGYAPASSAPPSAPEKRWSRPTASSTGSETRPATSHGEPVLAHDTGFDPEVTVTPWGPRQKLDPEVAASVKRAKERTRKSWRRISRVTGVSKSHLVQISNGDRCPSLTVVEALSILPFEDGELDRLRGAAAVGRGRDRR